MGCNTEEEYSLFLNLFCWFFNIIKLKAKRMMQNVIGSCVTLRNENRPFVEKNLSNKKEKKKEEEFQMVRSI